MDIVAVDPKLFITCRLCLEEMGQYQIVPTVQQQIKYCFDINVEPFDGLPQLICVNCKDILSNYSTTKKTFNEKQDDLKQNLLVKKESKVEPQQDTVSSTQTQQENTNQTKVSLSQKRLLQLSSSSESDSRLSYVSRHKKKKRVVKTPISWESDYKKHLICRLCNSQWSTTRSMMSHYGKTHETIKYKYSNILDRYCTVNIDKLDDKPNITGLSNMVVHSKRKIIQSSRLYYILYSKIGDSNVSDDSLQNNAEKSEHSHSTDEEETPMKRSTQRKRRLLSRSSNDTVVLETHSNKVVSDAESNEGTRIKNQSANVEQCINIVDTTDSESGDQSKDESNIILKKIIEPQIDDYKSIRGIISTCVSNYQKKKDDLQIKQPHKLESKLKHIILSIGRKIIHSKQSINCTGLLRYMEQKNLEIKWITRTYFNKSSSNNFVRIFTKLKVPVKTNDSGWVNVYPSVKPNTLITAQQAITDNPAIPIYFDLIASASDNKNKILNANPVANPKQLPKKLAQTNESRSNKTCPQGNIPSVSNEETQSKEPNSNLTVPTNTTFIISSDDNSSCMPIITSTTSLADYTNKEQGETVEKSTNSTSEVSTQNIPRIKVKPVSELMELGPNNFMAGQIRPVASNTLLLNQLKRPQQNPLNIIRPSFVPTSSIGRITSPVQIVQEPNLDIACTLSTLPTTSESAKENRHYLTLDTVELPNTKTDSPFQYFKNLLLLHNLILVDSNETLSQQFVCLIKFKVVFKQETKDQPVVLCLSLFCLRNMFCLKVRDIDVYKISANWQWEILQTYTGEVVDKLLQNAQKNGQETFDNTNNFLCLLKSIKLIKL